MVCVVQLLAHFINYIGAFYYTLGNIRPEYRSQLKSIQLLCLCKTSIIKKYGVNKILEEFMKDLGKLEKVCNFKSCIHFYTFLMEC